MGFLPLLPFAIGASAALINRTSDTCCFGINVSGGVTGPLGQIGDGQNRVGPSTPSGGSYCISDSGGITDGSGRGCVVSGPTNQYQCDSGASPTPGFSVGPNGVISHSGSSVFYACPSDSKGDYNIYTSPVSGQQCVQVTLTSTNGACATSSGSSAQSKAPSPTPSSAAPSSTKPTPTTVVSQQTVVPPASTVVPPASTVKSVSVSTKPVTSTATEVKSIPPTTEVKSIPPTTEVKSVPSPTTIVSEHTQTSVCPPPSTVSVTVTHSVVPTCPAPSTVTVTVTAPAPSKPPTTSTVVKVSTEQPSKGTPAPSPSGSAPASPYPKPSASPSPSGPASGPPSSPSPYAPGSQPAPSASPSAPGSQPAPSGTASKPAPSASPSSPSPAPPSSSSCPGTLSGEWQYPHLIVPVSSTSPSTSYGTQYTASVSASNSTIFNFDIPTSYAGKTCSVVFYLPTQQQLSTSSYESTPASGGSVDVKQLTSPASSSTSYSNAPAVSRDLGTVSVKPGSAYPVASGACESGKTVAFELSSVGGYSLSWFQDYNPCPIGLYVIAA